MRVRGHLHAVRITQFIGRDLLCALLGQDRHADLRPLKGHHAELAGLNDQEPYEP